MMFERLFSLPLNKEATMADMRRGESNIREWQFSWRRDLFEWEVELLQHIIEEISSASFRLERMDSIVWLADPSEFYSVKPAYSSYRMLVTSSSIAS